MKKQLVYLLLLFLIIYQSYMTYLLIGTGFVTDIIVSALAILSCVYIAYYIFKSD